MSDKTYKDKNIKLLKEKEGKYKELLLPATGDKKDALCPICKKEIEFKDEWKVYVCEECKSVFSGPREK